MDEGQRDLLRAVEAPEVLRRAANVVHGAGIRLMPLKGVWLQRTVYDPPYTRTLTDVDVLAPPGRFDEARSLLVRAGFVPVAGHLAEVSLAHPKHLLPLDLHRDLFLPGAFALHTADVFQRGRLDEALFGFEVHLPDPCDVLAHLVGHRVKSRGLQRERHGEDFRRLARVLDPLGAARHLQRVGLARAARMALPVASDEPAVAGLLAALPPDRLGDILARVATRAEVALSGRRPWEALPSYLVDRSLAAGARALLLRIRARSGDFAL